MENWIEFLSKISGDSFRSVLALPNEDFLFVSTNYCLLPNVEMGVLIRDVAKALGWVHRNIARYGGDPKRIFVMGHSAGAQLAALLCTDDRYLKQETVPQGMRTRGWRHVRCAGHHPD